MGGGNGKETIVYNTKEGKKEEGDRKEKRQKKRERKKKKKHKDLNTLKS